MFVNNRFISSNIFIQRLMKAIFTIKSHFPVVFLFLELSGEFYDVNVSPQKTDIRFINEQAIFY